MSVYCKEIHDRIEEKVEKPVEQWVEKRRQKCKQRKCKKWCLCCNKWLCWIEVFLEKVITWVLITVVKWVVRLVCEIVDGLLSFVGLLVGLLFAIPIIGRLIHELWDFILELGWRIVGILGTIADILGWKWRKRLRICIIVLSVEREPRDHRDPAVATVATLTPHIDEAKRIYDDQANVELIVEGIHTIRAAAPDWVLDVSCDASAWWEDLWAPGGWFELNANAECFEGNARRLIGWGAPVVVFVVRDVKGKLGCSLGPFSDYVTVEGQNAICLAHELGHACSLWHHSDGDNLMFSSCGGTKLKKWQWVILRGSRHVTYF
jgi:hypothetical protein